MTLTLPYPDRFSIEGKIAPPAERFEIVVVGAGPAGCAAAVTAAGAGAKVLLIDENPVAAGLIGMDVPFHFGGRATAAVQTPERLLEAVLATSPGLAEAFEADVDVRLSTMAFGAWVNGPGLAAFPAALIGLADEAGATMAGFDRLIVATGARDLNLSFAGSDQPGVMGAQGFHTLVARYGAFAGRRLVILGTGALAARTARLALAHGLVVAALVETRATMQSEDAARLASEGIAVICGHVPLAAHGGPDGVTGLVLADVAEPSRRQEIACDTVCLAVGTVPVIDLLDVLGVTRRFASERGGHVPVVDEDGATSVPGVFAAGDCAGLDGNAEDAGHAAGRAALASLGRATAIIATAPAPAGVTAIAAGTGSDNICTQPATSVRATADLPLAYQMDWARALLATGGTDVLACLCEDVTRAELLGVQPPRYLGWRSNAMGRRDLGTLSADGPLDQDQIKRLTRACMGACQARRCREQVALTMAIGAGVAPETIPLAGYRAPVRPLPLATLASLPETAAMARDWNVWFGIVTQWISYDDIGTEREQVQMRAGMPY